MSKTNDPLEKLLHRFRSEWHLDNPVAFYDFLVAVRTLVTTQATDPRDAAMAIADTMFTPGVDDDPLREEITIVAGALEAGNHYPKHSWNYLSKLIDELGDRY